MPRRAMHLLIEPITPELRLPIEMIDIGKVHTRPEAVFDHPDAPLDFAFGLSRQLHRLHL